MRILKTVLQTTLALTFMGLPALAEKEPAWDVASPPGPSAKAPFQVTQGTWLSLDVSPDGNTVAFDLLGDIYLLDRKGGTARSLTSGLEWDMQPTFSPDGTKLAFTSDRGGGDNIWIMNLSTGESSAKPLTEEKFRLLNQPAWDPSGTHIVARKHFTGTRSLGAGEIWAYHVDGGKGVQLTKRANDQLDLGEPAFSPDGRYLYYSLDATGGKRFEYNKDVNKGIYAIERLDRQTGDIERIVQGSGGAATPTPSPDGEKLAFVRRVRGKTQLVLYHLADGAEEILFDGLERDMQETWAIHGVYPKFSWTADSQNLVFWAQGRLWELTLGNTRPTEIPFSVNDSRELREAVRFPVEVAPDRFEVKAVRKITASPAGDKIAFEALGRIWVQEGDNQPKPLNQLPEKQSSPVFVGPDEIVYISWSDGELGSVKSQRGQAAPVVLADKGRFGDHALSPDRKYLAYTKTEKNSLFDSRHTGLAGLYLKDLSTGKSRRVESSGSAPHFTKDSTALYFTKGYNPSMLVRLDLETGQSKVLFKGKSVTKFLLSPDEKTLAFRDAFDLFTTPYVPTGRTVDISGTSKNLPVEQVSKDVGSYFPNWTRGGELLWNVGNRVFRHSARLGQTKETKLVLTQALETPGDSSKVALVGGRVVTMREQQVFEKGTVLIKDDRIVAFGATGEVSIPSDYYELDCSGKTILPGLVDVHWHGSFSDGDVFPEVNYVGLSSLSFGVTTLHDPSNDTASVFTAREMQMAGQLLAPRIFSTGTILYGAKAPGYYAEVKSLQDAIGHLKRLKTWGAVSVKSYNQPRREQRQQVLEAARQTEMMVVPEGGSLFQHNMTMVMDGHTGIEHALPVAKLYDDVLSVWSHTEVGYTPTLGVAYGGIWGENYWYVQTDVWDDERLNRFVPREVIDPAARRRVTAPTEEYNHINAAKGAAALAERGVRVNLGAHGQREGLAAHWELWMLVQGGMTPHQALQCGTINGARYLGLEGDIGSIEVGKLADLVVVEGNPLDNIRQSKQVTHTVLGGKVYEADSMRRIGPGQGDEPKLWWRN